MISHQEGRRALAHILRSRYLLLFLLFLVLFYHHKKQNEYLELLQKKTTQLESCLVNSESIVSKLQVLFDHKERLESQCNVEKNVLSKELAELKGVHRRCEKENKRFKKMPPRECAITNNNETESKDFANYTLQLRNLFEENGKLHSNLSECQKLMEQYVGAVPVAHYSENNTAFFHRKHKAAEALSFDRTKIEFSQGEILSGKELAEKLEARRKERQKENEQMEVHPDDRNIKENDLNDVPNKEEEDYKEGQQV